MSQQDPSPSTALILLAALGGLAVFWFMICFVAGIAHGVASKM